MSKQFAVILTLGGGAVISLAILADWIGLGGQSGFGPRQSLIALAGSALALVGIAISQTVGHRPAGRRTVVLCYGLAAVGLVALLGAVALLAQVTLQSTTPAEVQTEDKALTTSDVLLKNLVLSSVPEVGDPHLSDFERVSLLRHWAARQTDSSAREGLLDRASESNPHAEGFDFYHQDAPAIYAAFMEDWGGVWCRGTSYALENLYELFGFRAFSISFGIRGTYVTHVFTLVEIDREGETILSMQDADFDFTFTYADGRPMDYFEFLDLLQQRRHQDVVALSSAEDLTRDYLEFDMDGQVTKYQDFLSWQDWMKHSQSDLDSFLEERGYPPSSLYLHLSFLGIAGFSPPAGKESFLSQLADRGISVPEVDD